MPTEIDAHTATLSCAQLAEKSEIQRLVIARRLLKE
jgi:hypothetical protein